MRYTSYSRLLALLLVLFIIGGAIWFAADPVRAALGNRGVPVRCYKPGAGVPPGESEFLTCIPASGSGFSEGRVPEGYHFLVTDILITPDAGSDIDALTDVRIYAAYGESSRAYSLRFRNTTTSTYSEHFTTPNMVLPEGYRLEVANTISAHYVEVEISGLLVNNVTYVPLVAN
jgi:hypothetical protein